MTVKTTISEIDFKKIISDYDLGEYKSFETFANGATQTTVLLVTSSGKYVLRYYENRTLKHVLFEVGLFTYLRDKGYPVPKIIKTSSGELFGEYQQKPYILIEFVDGEHVRNPNEYFDQKAASEIIKTVALLHNLTKNEKPEFFEFHEKYDTEYCLREYRKQINKKDSDKKEKWLNDELDTLMFSTSLPKGICHADLNYSNFLFKDGKVVCVLDFDMSFYTNLIYDVADLIYWWVCPTKENLSKERIRFIVEEYSKSRELSEDEKKYIYDALKLIILLGIAWSKDEDFIQEKEKIDFLNLLGREGFCRLIF